MADTSSSAAGRKRISAETRAVFELLQEVVATFFKLRAVGHRGGSVNAWGGGVWGLLHSLQTLGPQTVPQLARARPVARQHIQKLADEMAEDGLVEFIDNPAHRRSRLLRMTSEGEAIYGQITGELLELCRDFATGQDLEDLQISLHTINDLKDRLTAIIESDER